MDTPLPSTEMLPQCQPPRRISRTDGAKATSRLQRRRPTYLHFAPSGTAAQNQNAHQSERVGAGEPKKATRHEPATTA